MIKKIKDYFKTRTQYNESKKAITLMILNQYSELLESERAAKDAELKAYESMSVFSENFQPEDLQNMITNINTIAAKPQLQTDYYTKVHEDAQAEKKLAVVK